MGMDATQLEEDKVLEGMLPDDFQEYLDLKAAYEAFKDENNVRRNNFEEFRKCVMAARKYEQKYGEEDAELLYMIGEYYFIEKEFQKSLEYFKKAYELGPEENRRLLAIGHCLFKLKRVDEAQEILEKYCALEKEHGLALSLLGRIYYYKNELILARKYFIKSRYYDVDTSKQYIKKIDKELKYGIVNKHKKLENEGIHLKSNGILAWIYKALGEKCIKIILYIGVIGWMLCSSVIKLLLWIPRFMNRRIKHIEFKKVENLSDFIELKEGSIIEIKLEDKYTTQFYLMQKKNGSIDKKYEILEEKEIDENSLWEKVIGQLYYAIVDEENLFVFFDKKFLQGDQHRVSRHKLKLFNMEMRIGEKIAGDIWEEDIMSIDRIFIRL